MWVARLKIFHGDCLMIPRAKKFDVTVTAYPLGETEKGNTIYFTTVGTVQGKEKAKKAFLADLKKDKRIQKMDTMGSVFFTLDKREKSTKHLRGYRKVQIFFIKPIIIKGGFEYWEIAAWDKNQLTEFYKHAKANRQVELLKLKQERLSEIFIPNAMQRLTKRQKQALELAYKHGYYEYPRKTRLENLAENMDCSLATFQEHLRKAEIKIIPSIIEGILAE